jgi:hypothetical protein
VNRTVLALIAAALAAALAYAVVIGTLMLLTAGVVAPLWMLAFGGMLCGTVFAVVVLLPLWYLFRRDVSTRWVQLGLPAVALWAAISAALFATRDVTAFELVGNVLSALPAGVASVVAFVFVIRGSPHA